MAWCTYKAVCAMGQIHHWRKKKSKAWSCYREPYLQALTNAVSHLPKHPTAVPLLCGSSAPKEPKRPSTVQLLLVAYVCLYSQWKQTMYTLYI